MQNQDAAARAGEELAKLARGEISVAEVAGLGAEDLAKILQLALAQLQIGKKDKAIQILRGLVALDDRNPVFHEYLGIALERDSDLEGALAEYTRNVEGLAGIGDRSRLSEAHLLRSRVQALRGDRAAARQDLEAARRNDPGNDADVRDMIERLASVLDGGEA